MDLNNRLSGNELFKNMPNQSPLSNFTTPHMQKWEDPSIIDYRTRIESPMQGFNQVKIGQDGPVSEMLQENKTKDWDPTTMLNNLSFLEQKVHQLQDLVHLIIGRRNQALGGRPDDLVSQQQQLITADLTSIIVQLISTAGSLMPSVKQNLSAGGAGLVFPSVSGLSNAFQQQNESKPCDFEANHVSEDHDLKDDVHEEDVEEGENLPPGSYEILQPEKEEILAPHTHFCTICGKGFKRDANLRMHMRGHGDEYKTAAALAKPPKEPSLEPVVVKRYSCPYTGCKRNKEHKKFQPLKTILCVKNHYKRTHCDKSYICSRCHTKKFSVVADLKTHEKHCGKDKWLCSCGTTFSRKDKLFGHIALFQGHTPAIPVEETKAPVETSMNFNFPANTSGESTTNMHVKGNVDDPVGCFSPLSFDSGNFSGFSDFPRPPFDDTDSSFSFLFSGSFNYGQKNTTDPIFR